MCRMPLVALSIFAVLSSCAHKCRGTPSYACLLSATGANSALCVLAAKRWSWDDGEQGEGDPECSFEAVLGNQRATDDVAREGGRRQCKQKTKT